jgi:hypothetical protein
MDLQSLSKHGLLNTPHADSGGVVAFFRQGQPGEDQGVLREGLRCLRVLRTHGRALVTVLQEALDTGQPEGAVTFKSAACASEIEEIALQAQWHETYQPLLGDPPELLDPTS